MAGSYLDSYEPRGYATEKPVAAIRSSKTSDGNDWTWAYGSPSDYVRWKNNESARSVGGGRRSGSGSSRTVTTVNFTRPAPQAPTLPTLEMPKVNEKVVRSLAQKAAAPGVRSLREAIQTVAGQQSDNPNVRRMTLREALQGYGAGLERVMGGAQQQARTQHMQDIEQQGRETMANYQTSVNAAMDTYNKAFQEYMSSAEKISTTEAAESPETSDYIWTRDPSGSLRQSYSQDYYARRKAAALRR